MRTPPRLLRCLPLAIVLGAAPVQLHAQLPGDDSAAARASQPVAVWGSVALGSGTVAGSTTNLLAGALRANVSIGRVLLTYRNTDIGPLFSSGPGVRDDAFMIGARTAGRRFFAAAALGYDSASPYHQSCGDCSASSPGSSSSGLAYDLSLHANAVIPGLAVSLAGVAGPAQVRYTSFSVGVELGWFGR